MVKEERNNASLDSWIKYGHIVEVFTGRLWPWMAEAWVGLGRVGCEIYKIPAVAMAMAAKF